MGKGQDLYARAARIIPGGTQLFSKRPELCLPGRWPTYYARAAGCEIEDLDGVVYRDCAYMGIGACLLGYADPTVDAAVREAVASGSMSTLNAPEEVELAELLLDLHPWAGGVRYARTGGEAMAVAVRIARAASGRDKVLLCGYHGWQDWYLAANLGDDEALDGHLLPGLAPVGVPRALAGTAVTFSYNDTAGFLAMVAEHGPSLGAVVMEPIRDKAPEPGFLETVRAETRRLGVPLVFDEVTAGFRLAHGGAHLTLGVEPDVAVFAKAISNGYPMAAVIGVPEVMEAAQDSFISSTYWTERVGPSAALACIGRLGELGAHDLVGAIGREVKEGWAAAAASAGLDVRVSGVDPLPHLELRGADPLVLKTLYSQLMLDRGFLATNAFYACVAHTPEVVGAYLDATAEVFGEMAEAIASGDPASRLEGPVCMSGFKRLT